MKKALGNLYLSATRRQFFSYPHARETKAPPSERHRAFYNEPCIMHMRVTIQIYTRFPVIHVWSNSSGVICQDFVKKVTASRTQTTGKNRVAVISAKNHKRQRRKRQSVTA